MINSDYEWMRGRTFFKGRWYEITFMRRTDRPTWDKHWQILGKYADNKKKLEEERKTIKNRIEIVQHLLFVITIILATTSLYTGFVISYLNLALGASTIALAIAGEVFRRTHFVHYGNAVITATPSLSAKAEVLQGDKSEEKD